MKDIQERIQRRISTTLESNWVGLGTSGCDNRSFAIRSFPLDPQENISFLDNSRLDALIPKNLPDGSTSHLRKSIDTLKGAYGDHAALYCSNKTILEAPEYAAIANSEYTQALCRCALTRTIYETLQPKLDKFQSRHGIYSCATVAIENGSMVIETIFSLLDVSSAKVLTCSEIGTGVPPTSISRVESNLHWQQNGKQGSLLRQAEFYLE